MSVNEFKHAYKNSNIKQLRKYIKLPKVLCTKKFVTYLETSFVDNREVYDILVLILFNQYDLTRVISDIIDRDNVDLLERILSNNYDVELDKNLILKTEKKGRITMAKAIYEYIYDVKKNSYKVIMKLLEKYNFGYNVHENSIDSFVLAILRMQHNNAENIISHINPNFWNNFAIKLACRYDQLSVVKRLLSHEMVDPGASNNCAFKLAVNYGYPRSTNEMIKHPLLPLNYITTRCIRCLIQYNYVCATEKVLRLGDDNIVAKFKKESMVDLMIEYHNDVTYLAIKLGIFNVSELIDFYPERKINIKKHLASIKLDKKYVNKPYELNLDSKQILQIALKDNDVDLAKSIKNYSVSICVEKLLSILDKYDNDITDYICNEASATYDPNIILPEIKSYNIFEKIFNTIVQNNPDINCVYIYLNQCDGGIQKFILKYVKKEYSDKYYKKFRKDVGL
jgi:hypothetical protein